MTAFAPVFIMVTESNDFESGLVNVRAFADFRELIANMSFVRNHHLHKVDIKVYKVPSLATYYRLVHLRAKVPSGSLAFFKREVIGAIEGDTKCSPVASDGNKFLMFANVLERVKTVRSMVTSAALMKKRY
jgi:hypothetical protein